DDLRHRHHGDPPDRRGAGPPGRPGDDRADELPPRPRRHRRSDRQGRPRRPLPRRCARVTTVNPRIGQITVNSDGGLLTPVELNNSAWRYLEATLFELTRGLTYSHSNIERPGDYDLVVPPFP